MTPPEELLGLAVDPQDPRVSAATGEQRGWVLARRTPPAVGAAGEELLAATHESRVMSSSDGGKTWRDLLEGGQRGSASYRSAWTESRSSRARSLEPVLERREGA